MAPVVEYVRSAMRAFCPCCGVEVKAPDPIADETDFACWHCGRLLRSVHDCNSYYHEEDDGGWYECAEWVEEIKE